MKRPASNKPRPSRSHKTSRTPRPAAPRSKGGQRPDEDFSKPGRPAFPKKSGGFGQKPRHGKPASQKSGKPGKPGKPGAPKPTREALKRRRPNADWQLMSRKEKLQHERGELGASVQKRRVTRPKKEDFAHDGSPLSGSQRIQKILSVAGIASRREAEAMIHQGRVMVNDERATIGQKVDLDRDKVVVDGARMKSPGKRMTYVLNKPRGFVSTRNDERGRPTVLELIKGADRYLYPVGRLDYDSEGLMLITNDGELANGLTHPRHQVAKTYRALTDKMLDDDQVAKLTRGVMLEDGMAKPVEFGLHRKNSDGFWYEIVIREGRNRQVRRMFSAVGAGVRRLVRVAIGPLRLAELPAGAYRPITPEELALLKEAYAHHSVSTR